MRDQQRVHGPPAMPPLASFALLARAAAAAAAAGGGGFEQDRFVTSMWVDPQVPAAEFDERYREVAAANFSVVLSFGSTTRATVRAKLDACEKHGLKALVSTCESAAPPFAGKPGGSCINISHPALWGFELADEPRASDFPAVAAQAANLAARRPDALRFVNLLPNYATPQLLGNETHPLSYGEYVAAFIKAARPQILSMDHYPHFRQVILVDTCDTSTGAPRLRSLLPYHYLDACE